MEQVPCGYATEGQGVTPLAAALETGSMREQGLNVSLSKLGNAHAVAKALEDGDIRFGNLAAPGLVDAVGHGANLVFLAGGVNQQFLVGQPGQSLRDVTGEPLGASQPADLTDFLVQLTMARVLKAQSEVRFVGSSRARLEALQAGTIAATPLSPPHAIVARQAGFPWLYDYGEMGLNFAIGGIAASRKLVRDQPKLVASFLRGYLDGQRRYKQDREFGIGVHERYGEVSRSVAEETYDVTRDGFRDVPDPATEGMGLLIEFWKANGTLPQSFEVANVVESNPVLAVCETLGNGGRPTDGR
jgi:ABC-type nitrate/sulfonate/bicarbonate transport system substrate-binding protein